MFPAGAYTVEVSPDRPLVLPDLRMNQLCFWLLATLPSTPRCRALLRMAGPVLPFEHRFSVEEVNAAPDGYPFPSVNHFDQLGSSGAAAVISTFIEAGVICHD